MINIGKMLKYARIKKNLSQEDMAKLIGIDRTTLTGYETNRIKNEINNNKSM